MICPVCEMPQSGPHKMSCRSSEREAAERRALGDWHPRRWHERQMLMAGAVPWSEAPTRGAMLARLDAFLARYANTCDNPEKAASVRALAQPRLPGIYP